METLVRRRAVCEVSARHRPGNSVPRRPAPAQTPKAPPARHRPAAPFGIALATGLVLAGCASGIDRLEEVCAVHRAAAAFASCLRSNHATLTSGPGAQKDLAAYYLAVAEHQADRVARGEATDPEAMLEITKFRMTEIATKERERQDAFDKEWKDFKDAFSGGKAFGASARQLRFR